MNNIKLEEEVRSSFVLKTYNSIYKLVKFIPYFKWTAGILFVIGFLETIIFGEINKFTMWANIIVWAPGIIFAFVGGFFHFWTGVKLREMCEKYQMEQEELQGKVSEILNSK
jgi:phosphotransferase system  glucose/maltose/N-acetylglucosamine-specific IIC component